MNTLKLFSAITILHIFCFGCGQSNTSTEIKQNIDKEEKPSRPCPGPIASVEGGGASIESYEMGNTSEFELLFDFDSKPDDFEVFCGIKDENGILIWSETDAKHEQKMKIKLSDFCKSDWATIKIIPDGQESTWRYEFNCLQSK